MLDTGAAEMLALSAIAYRGMLAVGSPAAKRAKIRQLIERAMNDYNVVRNRWDVMWGPANFSPTIVGLDSFLMYVAQSRIDPSAIVIAIRGTNSLSLSDWIFEDCIVDPRADWPCGNSPGAKISASTALGIGILLHVLAQDGERVPAGAALAEAAADVRVLSILDWVADVGRRIAAHRLFDAVTWLDAKLNGLIDGTVNPIALFEEGAPSSQPAGGKSILTVLKDFVASEAIPQIIVTGHSKGGALASTLALWLADTQGPGPFANPAVIWDPKSKSKISTWSFAGPTAGNIQFAAHSNSILANDCHRIWNTMDAVPCAFVSNLIRAFPSLHQLGVSKPVIDALFTTIANAVARFDYTHPAGNGLSFVGQPGGPLRDFLLELGYQHLDAYLVKYGLDNQMRFADMQRVV